MTRPSTRPVVREDGQVFGSVVEAASCLGMCSCSSTIKAVCDGKRHTAGGQWYMWLDEWLVSKLYGHGPSPFSGYGSRTCPTCGETFAAHAYTQRYCSPECKHEARAEIDRARARAYRERKRMERADG